MGSRNNNKKWIRTRSNEPKSTDELNYEELREFAQEGSNRFCFDCHQRGPTYVNMTIGSFVCMRCSGLLRGLTPPHRVKSMSMATFTMEEMEYLHERGNDYCKQIWLQLFEGNVLTEYNDEQDVKDFMIHKYERKRYYVDPKITGIKFRINNNNTNNNNKKNVNGVDGDKLNITTNTSLLRERTTTTTTTTTITNSNNKNDYCGISGNNDFVADFSKADIFIAEQPLKKSTLTNGFIQHQPSFANFENNPIFNSNNTTSNNGVTTGTGVGNDGTTMVIKPQIQSKLTSQLINNKQHVQHIQVQPPTSEDRYAALKDLDDALKTQQQQQQQHQQYVVNNNNNNNNEQQTQHILDWIGNVNNNNSATMMIGMSSSSVGSSISSFGSPSNNNTNIVSGGGGGGGSAVWNPFSTNTSSPWVVQTTSNDQHQQQLHNHNINPFRTTSSQQTPTILPIINNNNNHSLFTTINPFKQTLHSTTNSPSTITGIGTPVVASSSSSHSYSTSTFSKNPFL